MRKVSLLFLCICFVISGYARLLVTPALSIPQTSTSSKIQEINPSKINAEEFIKLSTKEFEKRTGMDLSFSEKIGLKLAQHKVRKQLKKGEDVNMQESTMLAASGIDLLWLLIGAVLGLIGVIIALLTKKGKDDNRVRSSLIGWLIWIVVAVLFII
jgi:hypothetical protein